MAHPADFERSLAAMADELWANSDLSPSEYAALVLGLLFLRLAGGRARRGRFERLRAPPPGGLARTVHGEMKRLESERPELRGALPRSYARLDARSLRRVIELVDGAPAEAGGDALGRAFEYFFGRFAPRALQKGGEFYTPPSVVRLIVAILEPRRGKLLDPACGAGGMLVEGARFAEGRRSAGLTLHGIEKSPAALRLARLNLAAHDRSASLVLGNAYYDARAHAAEWGRFDFVAANPPFNQGGVDRARLARRAERFPFGVPSSDNANALWIQLFYSALHDSGRAGFVLANTASESRRASDVALRKKLLEAGAIDAIVALGPNLFYTVTLPVTLWFLDKGKVRTPRRNRVLFVDARGVFRQVDRAHRDLSPTQIEMLANVVRLFRGQSLRDDAGGGALLRASLPRGAYDDVPGLCRAATLGEIEAEGFCLSPGRYVRPAAHAEPDPDYDGTLARLGAELRRLGDEARTLERRVRKEIETGPRYPPSTS